MLRVSGAEFLKTSNKEGQGLANVRLAHASRIAGKHSLLALSRLLKSGSYFGFDLPSGNFVALMGRVTCLEALQDRPERRERATGEPFSLSSGRVRQQFR
jgi:hypothetical protein